MIHVGRGEGVAMARHLFFQQHCHAKSALTHSKSGKRYINLLDLGANNHGQFQAEEPEVLPC